ncbi:oligopeptide transport system substrate-binding protein [Paracoccus halophilus]|uniref:Oligopeptide transport system substrate-binding protein n=1 Tax=Paracoccus halophilus TaxID=376733 RepID=A0A099EZ07_9RHOB|nr:peptide ABC transporter substrate-binding protein [Paracoccus halophilus]KGJ03685.1 peptide ABC transporter substrate-binding protein [Paracoccus halophilus]SFA57191.1 oligopeptide transport system substrate-binding protein [Paracoccus halophilus]
MTKLFIATALAAVLALPAFAATPAEGEQLAEDQSLDFWILDAIKSLDPQLTSSRTDSDLIRQLFEGLLNEDAKGAMIPGAAESWEVSEDGLTYTFHLREAKWSNGDPVTAGDFVYAWQRAANPATASEYAWFIELMNITNAAEIVAGEKPPEELGARAVDDRTLEVTLSKPTPYFLKTLSHSTTYPAPQKVIEAEGDAWTQPGKLVGNGAYVLESHELGVQATAVRNENYWDAANTIMDRVTFVTVNDQNIGLTRYLAGEIDWMNTLPAGQFPRLQKEYPDQAVSTPWACSYSYLFNLSDKGPEALKDLRVRQALSYAVDRDIIVERILQGGQKPAYYWTHWAIEGFEPPEIEMAGWTQPERVEKAKALLAEAGYGPDNPLSLTIQYNTSEDHKKLAIAVQQFWKAIGVNVTLNNYEWKVHIDRLNNQDFEVARYAWCGDYNEASTFLDYFRSGGYNQGKYSNPEYDALLDQAATAENPAELYRQAEQLLIADMPLAPAYHYAQAQMINADLRGVPLENVMSSWYAKDMYRVAE